jgi:hypothetical protein
MGYRMYARGITSLDSTYHQAILARTGRSTQCMRGRGITAVMKEKFFPDYVYRQPSGGGPILDRKGAVGAVKKPGRGSGMARGRLVDHEIQRWVENSKGIAVNASNITKTFHPFSRAFIALTQRLRLTPVSTQVVVRDETCNIATLVDAVFLNSSGRVVVVELKTGFEGYNDISTGRMHAEFAHLTYAPANQHSVQLAFTHAMFESTFPEFGAADALLIRMTSYGAHVRSLCPRERAAARQAMQQASSF